MAGSEVEIRNKIVDDFKALMIGPVIGVKEILNKSPLHIYTTGILFPQNLVTPTFDESTELENDRPPDEIIEENSEESYSVISSEKNDEPEGFLKTDSFEMSVFGLSFIVKDSSEISGRFNYEFYSIERDEDGKKLYKASDITTIYLDEYFRKKDAETWYSEDQKLRFYLTRKKVESFYFVTIQVANNGKLSSKKRISRYSDEILEYAVFRPQLIINPGPDNLLSMSEITGSFKSIFSDDKVENMLFSTSKLWAKGQNCALKYKQETQELITKFIPDTLVRKLQTDQKRLKIEWLKAEFLCGDRTEVIKALEEFSGEYSQWISSRKIPDEFLHEANENLELCKKSNDRIKSGIEILKQDDNAWQAWLDTNIVLNQQYGSFVYRPFQLGFFLLSIPGLVNESSNDRNLCDLLWIPTGGGKTEAYLAVSSFLIFYRRLKYKEHGSGVTVLSRYTLRLLTAQQFFRTAKLVCYMELVRKKKVKLYGKDKISLGLFIGAKSSPNTLETVANQLNKFYSEEINPFPLKNCPYCGNKLYNTKNKSQRQSFLVITKSKTLKIICRNAECPFSKPNDSLPLHFVDETIYHHKPSIIIATVDKLAMLPFKTKDYIKLFKGKRIPDLIIQDELHLIDSTLGSMYGIYETGFRLFLNEVAGTPEYTIKIIASTATPKQSDAQIGILFDRKARIFPQPAININDSFFSKLEQHDDCRRYIGLYPSGMPVKTAARDVLTALLASIAINRGMIDKNNEQKYYQVNLDKNDYYKLITTYFNSLRELGGISAMIYDDIPKRIPLYLKMLAFRHKQNGDEAFKDMNIEEGIYRQKIYKMELTSRVDSGLLNKNLDRLGQGDSDDVLFSTSMISVGLDIPSLNIMMVNGQPKKTAEYIQSTSRAGRKKPGIVFTLYNPWRVRDTSHYEYFYPYHESFYRYVEPVTVTPYSPQVLERALHAQIITLLRNKSKDVSKIVLDEKSYDYVKSLIAQSIRRNLINLDKYYREDDIKYIIDVLNKNSEDFKQKFIEIKEAEGYYAAPFKRPVDGERKYLIKPHGKKIHQEAKPTMTSLRDVSPDIPLKIFDLDDYKFKTDNLIRSTSYVFTFGPGAIYETEKNSVMNLGPDYWIIDPNDDNNQRPTGCQEISDIRLARLLNKETFYSPPDIPDDEKGKWEFIYANPFPGWMICRDLRCRRLFHYKDHLSTRKQIISECKEKPNYSSFWKIPEIFCPFCNDGKNPEELLEKIEKNSEIRLSRCYPFRWIVVCPDGHIDEVPIHKFMHPGKLIKRNDHEYKFSASPDDASMGGLTITCLSCSTSDKKHAKPLTALMRSHKKGWLETCTGKRPWLDTNKNQKCNCKSEDLKIVQKGDTLVYYSDTISSVTIPPWNMGEIINKILKEMQNYSPSNLNKYLHSEDKTESLYNKVFDDLIILYKEKLKISDSKIDEQEIEILKKKLDEKLVGHISAGSDKTDENKTDTFEWQYRYEEFSAFGNKYAPHLVEGFRIRPQLLNDNNLSMQFMKKLVIADLLKITTVQKSLSRVTPVNQGGKSQIIMSKPYNWLPGIQIFSEGIFIEFDRVALENWFRNNRTGLSKRFDEKILVTTTKTLTDNTPEKKAWFYLIHSFSHFIINALSFQCGYNAASLRERLYFSSDPEKEMYGLLITTSCGDSEASYGGLAWYGDQKRFYSLINTPIRNVENCSNDPLCSEGVPSKANSNYAACFNCLILPETSCEFMNDYLDRILLYGNIQKDGINGFFRSFF